MMRAKFRVTKVEQVDPTVGPVTYERVSMLAVSEKPFDSGGSSEDNTFAKWTPAGVLEITIQNPDLFGKIKEGEKFYLDFTPVND